MLVNQKKPIPEQEEENVVTDDATVVCNMEGRMYVTAVIKGVS